MVNYKINILKMYFKDIGDLKDVVYKVDWEVVGEKQEETFSSPQYTELNEPISTNFVPKENFSVELIASWVEELVIMDDVRSYVEMMLDQKIKDLENDVCYHIKKNILKEWQTYIVQLATEKDYDDYQELQFNGKLSEKIIMQSAASLRDEIPYILEEHNTADLQPIKTLMDINTYRTVLNWEHEPTFINDTAYAQTEEVTE